MKILRIPICIGLVLFLMFTPSYLVSRSRETFIDARFVRKEAEYRGSVLLYHIVRQRPYSGSLTQWLKDRAKEYEKKHRGIFIEIEGMDEASFYERIENGRKPDAYSFFTGSVYRDRLQVLAYPDIEMRSGIFMTDRAVPYCYTGFCRLLKNPDGSGNKAFWADDILAARMNAAKDDAPEEIADILYLDLRRAGDLIRYRDGFAVSAIEPVDSFTDAVCWIGVDRDTDAEKTNAIRGFIAYLLEADPQKTLNALGLMSVRSDIRNVPPDASLKKVFKTYESVQTVDPFLWQSEYDSLRADAAAARTGDTDARIRFTKRLQELYR